MSYERSSDCSHRGDSSRSRDTRSSEHDHSRSKKRQRSRSPRPERRVSPEAVKALKKPSSVAASTILDPFDESFFEEKTVDLAIAKQEADGWEQLTRGSERARKPEVEVKQDSSREYDKNTPVSVGYTFGDKGSEWRMMKLRSLEDAARELKRPFEELAFERYGTLEKYDEAREEDQELSRRKLYGISKTKPTGDLYRERVATKAKQAGRLRRHEEQVKEDIKEDEMASNGQVMTLSDLNGIKAKLLKTQLMQSEDARHLEQHYKAALEHYEAQQQQAGVVILQDMDSRGTGIQKTEDDMTIEDMVREEKRESKLINAARQDADRIAKDGKYNDSFDYQDENADKLAKRVQHKELNLKNMSISQYQKMQKVLESCPLCHKEEGAEPPIAPVVSLATRTFLSLPSAPLTRYHCLIVPLQHRVNTLECDDDEWAEIRNFMKSLTRMYDSLGLAPMFYESNARPYKKSHAAIECIPVPRDAAGEVPRFWHEALLSADEEWSQHRPLIKTDGKTFARKMTPELAYFHVWFDLNGGLGHVIEDDSKWPKGDLFGREVVGSILGLDITVWRRHGQWDGDKNSKEMDRFKAKWDRWDWTKALIEQ